MEGQSTEVELCATRTASSNSTTDSEQQHNDRQKERTDARDQHEKSDDGDYYRWPKRLCHDPSSWWTPLTVARPRRHCVIRTSDRDVTVGDPIILPGA